MEKEGDRDFVFNDPSGRVIFEITGSEGAIGLGKLRQLFDFIMDDEKKLGTPPKGVLVANHEIDLPPKERGQPFTKHVLDRARGFGVCLLPSIELFRAVVLFRELKLEPAKFWTDLLKTIGVFELKR